MTHKFKVGDLVKINPNFDDLFENRWKKGVVVVKTVHWNNAAYSIARTTSGGKEERRYVRAPHLRPPVPNKKLEDYL